MKFNIKTRDVKFFALGIIAAFIFATIYDWEDNVKLFKEGYENGKQKNPL
ncbi:hypothetical protein [Autumnicola edwardsiae]|uniref:Uncharacterized protein n=1 Tax=Autumnicola edwardsiae TaxID=3075594 RepID=A0ABU3CW17_9FLAO|nr:hypothetical protein [Zunongwangia sp. F297]MDT0650557.1 hypothetical protein [Zunongwangia sp. F297]